MSNEYQTKQRELERQISMKIEQYLFEAHEETDHDKARAELAMYLFGYLGVPFGITIN